MAPMNRRKPTSFSTSGNHSSSHSTTDDNHPGWETREGGNRYQFKGAKEGFESKAVKDGLYLRIDMPGVVDDGAKVWMEGKDLFFSGEAYPVTDFESQTNRVYGGCIDLSSDDSGRISEIKTIMKNGVLRIMLVGCGIKPDCSHREPLWRPGLPKPRPTPSSKALPRQFYLVGDYLVSFRSMSSLDPPDESSTGLYPFQLSGPLESCEKITVSECHLFVRIDVPDLPSERFTVKVRDNIVFWGGEGVKLPEDGDENRGYFGKYRLTCGCCSFVILKYELKYGVFRMLLEMKQIKPVSESAGATGKYEGCGENTV